MDMDWTAWVQQQRGSHPVAAISPNECPKHPILSPRLISCWRERHCIGKDLLRCAKLQCLWLYRDVHARGVMNFNSVQRFWSPDIRHSSDQAYGLREVYCRDAWVVEMVGRLLRFGALKGRCCSVPCDDPNLSVCVIRAAQECIVLGKCGVVHQAWVQCCLWVNVPGAPCQVSVCVLLVLRVEWFRWSRRQANSSAKSISWRNIWQRRFNVYVVWALVLHWLITMC